MPHKIYEAADQAIKYCFYFLLAATPFVFSPSNYELFEFPKMILVYATTIVILTLWATKSILVGKPIFRRTFLDIPLLIYLVTQLLSYFFSIDHHTSLWGFYTRSYGGLLSIVTFALLYWAYVSNMEKRETKNAIHFLLASVTIVSFWGILEHFGASPSCYFMKGKFDASCWEPDVSARVFASFGQPNWLAAWLAAVAPLSWALTIAKLQFKIKNWLLIAAPIAIFAAVVYTKSLSGLIGFLIADAIFWGSLLLTNHQSKKHFLKQFCILHFAFLILALASGTRFTPSISQVWQQHRTNNLSQSASNTTPYALNPTPSASDSTDSFHIRKIVWKGALDIWRAYPIFGSGVETFAYTYYNFRPVEHNLTSEWDLLYNKAHNEYLHALANTGVAGLVTYLLLIGAFLWWTLRRIMNHESGIRDHNSLFILHNSLLSGFTSILVTNITGFTTVPIATLFFLYPALAFSLIAPEKQYSILHTKYFIQKAVLAAIITLVATHGLFQVYNLWKADALYARADKLNDAGEGQAAAELLEKAIKLRPGEPRYHNELATSTSLVAADLAESADGQDHGKASEFAQLAEHHSDKALKISSRNVNLWSNRSAVFKRLVGIDQKYLALAIQALEQAIKLAPTEPEVHYNLGVLYTRSNQSEKAQQLLEKAVMLKTDYYDGRLGLAEFYLQSGEEEKAIEQFEHILEKINPGDKTVKEILETLRQQKQKKQ